MTRLPAIGGMVTTLTLTTLTLTLTTVTLTSTTLTLTLTLTTLTAQNVEGVTQPSLVSGTRPAHNTTVVMGAPSLQHKQILSGG